MTEVKFMHLGSHQDKILDISSIPLLDLVKLSNVSAMVSISSLTLSVMTLVEVLHLRHAVPNTQASR